ncbi:hypothetical protein K438DRAFT_1956438 [Mycena galopus ATCC 62051]|nr:hypothetical protein K438DRAFT_1956438 [Mycena galopus ATCC 62051]
MAPPRGSRDNPDSTLILVSPPLTRQNVNRRMDILFAESCRDNDGRLYYVRRGKLGMALLVQYLREVEWSEVPADLATIKLTRIITELEVLSNHRSASRASSPLHESVDTLGSDQIRATTHGSVTVEDIDDDDDDDDYEGDPSVQPNSTNKRKACDESSDESSEDEASSVPGPGGKANRVTKKRKKRCKTSAPTTSSDPIAVDPIAVDSDGLLIDVDVQPIETPNTPLCATADVNHFTAGQPFLKPGRKGADKLHRTCSLCNAVTVTDSSTFRRHLQKFHKPNYHA